MRILFVHSVVDEAGLSLAAFRVLAHFARRADRRRFCYPSVAGTAEVCRISRPTMIKAVRELETTGWIEAVRSVGRTTTYRLMGLTGKQGLPVNGLDRSNADTSQKEALHQSKRGTTPVKSRHTKDIHEGNPRRISRAPGLGAWIEYCASIGWVDGDSVREAWDYWCSVGWERKGGRKIKDWRAVARNAKRMRGKWGPRLGLAVKPDPQRNADGRIVVTTEPGEAVEPPTDEGADVKHKAWLARMREGHVSDPIVAGVGGIG